MTLMEATPTPPRRECPICGYELVAYRRSSRTTYTCPFTAEESHRSARRIARLQRSVEEMERNITPEEAR